MASPYRRSAKRAEPLPPKRALLAYFEGDLRAIEALPVAMNGNRLPASGLGRPAPDSRADKTLSYGELAKQIGRPAAVARGGARQRRETR